MSTPKLLRFLEATAAARKDVLLAPMRKIMARDVAGLFINAGQDMIKELAVLAPDFSESLGAEAVSWSDSPLSEALSLADWAYLMDNVFMKHGPPLENLIDTFTGLAVMAGAETLINDFGLQALVRFRLADPLAVQYASGRAAAQVTRINNTTRQQLNTLLTRAVADGKSWTATAKEIEAMYKHFAGPPLFPSLKFRSRSQAIAAFEIGDAYEFGNWAAARKIQSATGDPLVKAWLNAGDKRVRPSHITNASDGYIAFDEVFSGDNAERPPTDPGCRCTLVFQKA